LHVLGTPPAFVLSQDQTLREELHKELSGIPPAQLNKSRALSWLMRGRNLGLSAGGKRPLHPLRAGKPAFGSSMYTKSSGMQDGSILAPSSLGPHGTWVDGVEPGHTLGQMGQAEVRMLLSFQRPPHLQAKGDPSLGCAQEPSTGSRHRTDEYSQFPTAQQSPPQRASGLVRSRHSNLAGSSRRTTRAPHRRAPDRRGQRTRTRANRRFPSCRTRPSMAPSGRSSSSPGTGSPSIRTPPCASARRASEVETPNAR
jgi:hypothetical protein